MVISLHALVKQSYELASCNSDKQSTYLAISFKYLCTQELYAHTNDKEFHVVLICRLTVCTGYVLVNFPIFITQICGAA